MTDAPIDIRPLTAAEIDQAVAWAAREGWNPGHADAACFAAQDPEGFWGGFVDGAMVACISVVNYGSDFAFLGFYIVDAAVRGQGYGYALWQRALAHAGGRTVGLDGVVDQQENYRRSGFAFAWRNIRFSGAVTAQPAAHDGLRVSPLAALTAEVAALDARVFPAPRPAFWSQWLGAPGHLSYAVHDGATLSGFATLRPCHDGVKIAPLVATSRAAAETLLAVLLPQIPASAQVTLDVPEPHGAAVALAQDLGLQPVFETARMYRGAAPRVAPELIFAVTSFELG
ncbi:GNAT family N-acetyltransferase [Tritonibacter horizontis]|uniref:Acetyltransferase (GNAT) family protein n=1 Tax=Tritonibacter horizontis TaxID=1768241 RepID=A0A132BZT3_9RHOB|nr:GNAT family N-acetyltransferase [Tritonibacter horizontis]KUP93858.1 acetyltransferase (GNAT) family protein [Tritonibacter horizontis]